jgi:hypothetical protein
MKSPYGNHKRWIEDRLSIVNKEGVEVPFILNPIQAKFVEIASGRDIILKARQQGFSSFILAAFTADFLFKDNSRSVVVADKSDNAIELLERVKWYIESWAHKMKTKVPLKYNSKYELHLELRNTKFTIGTAENVEFGRSKTITNLHLSEAAFYPHLSKLLAGALQAVVPDGKIVIETTANGFNEFKTLWEEASLGERDFKPSFFRASDFYDEGFLNRKRRELDEQSFMQEYPETAQEAFITSGESYFDKKALQEYLQEARVPL